jgi:glycosyltransferase involved in cell wall biosynthesis
MRPPNPAIRAQLFPGGELTLLYSGTLGRAHEFEPFLELARRCRARSGTRISFCFAGRGNREAELRTALRPDDSNVSVAPFCSEAELEERLQSADIHLISLKPDWSGVVVPSKFFGSLAAGKPVLYSGAADSDIAQWIHELGVGLVLDRERLDRTVDALHELCADPLTLRTWQRNAFDAYRAEFSRNAVTAGWNQLLRTVTRDDDAIRHPGAG